MNFSTGQCANTCFQNHKELVSGKSYYCYGLATIKPRPKSNGERMRATARTIYKDGCQYQNVQALQQAITESWDKLPIDNVEDQRKENIGTQKSKQQQ